MTPRPRLVVATVVLALAAATLAHAQGHYQEFGDARGFLNIVPPGQDGSLNGTETIQAQGGTYPPHVIDQLGMYGDLVYNAPGLTEADLLDFYKDASFGTPDGDIERVYSPTANVTIVRDASFGVPHIFGETRYATMFAEGYATAEDRLFLMDVLRHVGRARMSEFLGAAPGNIQMDREQLAVAPYTEADLTAQLDALCSPPPDPEALLGCQDLQAYTDGVNQYITEATGDPTKLPAEYPALQQVPQPWKREDTVAIASLVGGIFGKGGGGELRNFCGLKAMATALGSAATARAVFDDLHFANDTEAPTTSRDPQAYNTNLGAVNPAAHPDIDCASLVAIDPMGPPLQSLLDAITNGFSGFGLPGSMSNAVLIGAKNTKTSRPIAVFGPQTGYFMPQLLVEKDVHGPDIDARGVAFAGTDLYVQLGRGRSYAWSATSAGADNIDQWVLRLCEPGGGTPTVNSLGYEHNGMCEPIEAYNHTQIAKPSAGGTPGVQENQCNDAVDNDGDGFVNDGCPAVGAPELAIFCADAVDSDGDTVVNDGCAPIAGPDIVLSFPVQRTAHYGPVIARGTLTDSTPIAIASLRSTYRAELTSARGFGRINNPNFMTNGFDSFRQAMGAGVDYTFNWFYIDAANIGYQHSCKCPQRAQGVDPDLPPWGDGTYDWQGFITLAQQPFDLNPAEGWITSWNNKQAPQFRASDANFTYGPVYRSQMLDFGIQQAIAGGNKVDRADVVGLMEDAGTVDLRGQEDLALLLQVMGPTAPGGSDPRAQDMRNRLAAWANPRPHRRDFDHSGEYDDPQSPAIMDAWWPRLSHAIFDVPSGNAIANLGLPIDDGNRRGHVGSAFQDGTYGHVNKDLRQILGMPVSSPWSRTYCGNGNLAACKQLLWDALSQAAADLQTEFSSPNVADWKRAIADEDVHHTPAGITSVPAIHWINRPTFQQVVQIGNFDHFKCYRVARPQAPHPSIVSLTDDFEARETRVLRLDTICNPVDKNGEGITDPMRRLACYKIRNDTVPSPARTVGVDNQLGSDTRTTTRPRLLCLAAEENGFPAATALDNFKCYRASRATPRFQRQTVQLSDDFENRTTLVRRPDSICNAVAVDAGTVLDPTKHLACYKIKNTAGQAAHVRQDVSLATPFASAAATTVKPSLLCVPARVEVQ
jgi:acyl-homoserine lactone acylase PvdQ